MKVYLARHGEAIPVDIDMQCPLSTNGRKALQRLVDYLRPQGVFVNYVYHSGKLRAQQTAELLASIMAPEKPIHNLQGLSPNDPVSPIVKIINGWTEDTLLVGHLPFMGKLVSALVADDESKVLVDFQPGTLVCLQRDEDWQWHIDWVLRPNELP